jgi:hypothetical protein
MDADRQAPHYDQQTGAKINQPRRPDPACASPVYDRIISSRRRLILDDQAELPHYSPQPERFEWNGFR